MVWFDNWFKILSQSKWILNFIIWDLDFVNSEEYWNLITLYIKPSKLSWARTWIWRWSQTTNRAWERHLGQAPGGVDNSEWRRRTGQKIDLFNIWPLRNLQTKTGDTNWNWSYNKGTNAIVITIYVWNIKILITYYILIETRMIW